jgi:peptide/nickel transport system substrate-binding protein
LFLTGVNQKGDGDLYPFWHSSQATVSGLNFSCLKNPEVDSLLEEGRQISNETERSKRYQKVAQVIQDEAAAFFLYQPVYYYQNYDIVKGKQETKGVTKADRFWNVNEWYLKTKKVNK